MHYYETDDQETCVQAANDNEYDQDTVHLHSTKNSTRTLRNDASVCLYRYVPESNQREEWLCGKCRSKTEMLPTQEQKGR